MPPSVLRVQDFMERGVSRKEQRERSTLGRAGCEEQRGTENVENARMSRERQGLAGMGVLSDAGRAKTTSYLGGKKAHSLSKGVTFHHN